MKKRKLFLYWGEENEKKNKAAFISLPDSKKRRRRRVFTGRGFFHVHHTGCVSTHLKGPRAAALALSAVSTVAARFLFSAPSLETEQTLGCAASSLTQSVPASSVPKASAAAGSDTVRQSPITSLRHLKGHSAANCPITAADFPFSGFPTPTVLVAAATDRQR